MATYSNQTKNSATFANIDKTDSPITWDDAVFTWDEASSATWDNPQGYSLQTKNSAAFTNETKN